MLTILTSSTGNSRKNEQGERIPDKFYWYNGFFDKLHDIWVENAKVLIIAGNPSNYQKNDSLCKVFKESFEISGLSVSAVNVCDNRNVDLVGHLNEVDVIFLTGGHVPTQNAFFKQIMLKEKLSSFNGTLIAWSAGSMNCAETVYAGPELDGEAVDPNYKRWISGLGLTKTNILPHFQSLSDEWLDGMRVVEDITFSDSVGNEIIALNDGSYIVIENGTETLFGEAYSIKDKVMKQICQDGKSFVMS